MAILGQIKEYRHIYFEARAGERGNGDACQKNVWKHA